MPEERQRRLEEIPEIHVDPNMDPSYESEEDEGDTDDKRQGSFQLLGLYCFISFFIFEIVKIIASGACRNLHETERFWRLWQEG